MSYLFLFSFFFMLGFTYPSLLLQPPVLLFLLAVYLFRIFYPPYVSGTQCIPGYSSPRGPPFPNSLV